MAIKQIKSGKAAGPDNIPAEALKSDIDVTTNMLHLLFKKIWEEEQVLMDWREGHPSIYQRMKIWANVRTTEASHYYQYQEKFPTVLLNWMKDLVDAQLRHHRSNSVRTGHVQTKSRHDRSSLDNQLNGVRHCT
ncbi:unnamed protein product [Schistosoma curassoni]|uniref:RT_RNaseH domain-containing protein n=1 Tax=Schistosoma curassoni TaxID=6186 RepID=A0A183JCN4_9TREM|nr:unnamed protein product [Schistosoma curassoni]